MLVILLAVVLFADWTRARTAVSDRLIYSDGLEVGWADWSWGVTAGDLCDSSEVYEGTCAASVDLAAWGGLSFRHDDFNTHAWESLSFYIHGGGSGGQQLQVFLHGAGGGLSGTELPPVSLNNPAYIDGGSVATAAWKQVVIPLSDLGGANTTISRVTIQAIGDQPAFSIDALRLLTPATPPPLTINVDAAAVQGTIPTTLFGGNAAMWSGNLHQNNDVITKLGAVGLTVLRFPGGSAADEYHWQDYEPGNAGNAWSTNTAEFIQFARDVGAEPMITVNFGGGTAQEAAAWVHFTNVAHDWNVKYWEIGNEIYGDWENSWTHDAAEYVNGDATHDGFNAFCQAMKAEDSTIQVGAVGTSTPDAYSSWGPTVLQLASDCLDFYVVHDYPFGPGYLDYAGLLAYPPMNWPSIGDNVRQMLADNAPGRPIDVGITEYNSYWTLPEQLAVETVNLLFQADTLGQIIEQGFAYANQWDILNGNSDNNARYGLLEDAPGYFRRPAYYAFPLWRRMGEQRLSSDVSLDATAQMTAYASRHQDTGNVTLLVVNKSDAVTGTITIDNFQTSGRVTAFVAQGDSLSDLTIAYNGDENPPVDLASVPPFTKTIAAATFAYAFPAYSVTSLTIERELFLSYLPVVLRHP